MAVEAHLTEEEVVMPHGRSGEDIAARNLLNNIVSSLGLAIHLRMVGRAVQQASTKATKQVLPKIAHKPGSWSEIMRLGMPKTQTTWFKNRSAA